MEKGRKSKIVVLGISALMIIVSVVGYTYSYFVADVKEVNKTETVIKTGEGINLVFTGEKEITKENIIPGDIFEKTFKVENQGNSKTTFNIYLENITNEFNEDLVYTLSDDNGVVIEETKLPETSDEKTYLKTNININEKETKNYVLKVEYKYSETENQSAYMGARFGATLGIDAKEIEKFSPICKRATELHTEICNQSDSENYCSSAGYSQGDIITYGNLGTKGVLASGDAFDCDVNGDGEYDANTERFYYVSDYYNTNTKSFEDDTAVLIYYNNISGGSSSSNAIYQYSDDNWHGPQRAKEALPTKEQWNNVNLKNETRAILNEQNENTTEGGINTLPSDFSYSSYAARLITAQEINSACNITIGNNTSGELNNCNYLMENTQFSNENLIYGYWIETPRARSASAFFVDSPSRSVRSNYVYSTTYGVRPVIEVAKGSIAL